MAQDQQTITCPTGEWTQLTNDDVTGITFQVHQGPIFIRYTTDTTAPDPEARGVRYRSGEGEQLAAISDLTALVGADRVWARPADGQVATVYVDHA